MGSRKRGCVSDFAQALQALLGALDRSAIPYLIGGSMASGIHGIHRTSLDAGLLADIGVAQAAELVRQLRAGFYADMEVISEALRCGRSFNLIHFASSYKFDIFPLSSDPFQQSQFSRREIRDLTIGAVTLAVPVSTAEDTLLVKLAWYRAGGEVSERQWNDVRGILAVQRDSLDRDYLRHWAIHLKVDDLLHALLASR